MAGEDFQAYTTSVLKNKPSPIPTTHLAATSIPMLNALASRAAPMAKTTAPRATARVLPKLSDKGPANSEAKVAGSRTDEMTMPCKVEESTPKFSVKDGIAVTGPMVPVSRLYTISRTSVHDEGDEGAAHHIPIK